MEENVMNCDDIKLGLTVSDIIKIIEYLNKYKSCVPDCDDDDIAIISQLIEKLKSISL